MPWRSPRTGFGALTGRLSCTPAAWAAQCPRQGQRAQAGRRGVQIVAPRSNSAWAKSPGRARAAGCSMKARARLARRDRAAGSGSRMSKSRAATRSTLPSTGTVGRSKAMAATAAEV